MTEAILAITLMIEADGDDIDMSFRNHQDKCNTALQAVFE